MSLEHRLAVCIPSGFVTRVGVDEREHFSSTHRQNAYVSQLKFSCQKALDEHINDVLVKALLAASGHSLPLARVGNRLLASSVLTFVGCKKNEVVDEVKVAGLTTVDFRQITVGESDHGRQR
jgi:hypothetical protein